MRLSPNFLLSELTRTSHRIIDNTPPLDVIPRLMALCLGLLEPVRAEFGPLRITSGYRCPALNRSVGGSAGSAHMFGCAADFVPLESSWTTTEIVAWVVCGELNYDQVINEFSRNSSWIHLGDARPGTSPRREALTMRHGKYLAFGE